MELYNDIFIIDSEKYDKIIYSPLKGAIFAANHKAAAIVKKYALGKALTNSELDSSVYSYLKQIEDSPTRQIHECSEIIGDNLTVILTQKCNLACSYCYAQNQRSSENLDEHKLKMAIDYYIERNINHQNKRIVFIGGGEPTIAWNTFVWAVEYVTNTYKESGVFLSLITNGTLLTSEKLYFLKQHVVNVVFSFEILPIIQNSQRSMLDGAPSFNLIDQHIREANEIGVNITGIRSTITDLNVKLMKDMVLYVAHNYPYIKHLNFEPVTSNANTRSFYDTYIDNFFSSRKIADSYGIKVYNSISISINTLKDRFCQREFCITPSGDITSCHRISSYKEALFKDFKIGYVTEHALCLEKQKINSILSLKQPMKQCSTCYAKYHCAGGCVSERLKITKEQKDLKCDFTRSIILKLFEEKVKFK